MRVTFAKLSLAALVTALGAAPAHAGGALETIDITANTPSPNPGQINAPLVRIFHDPRCIPVRYLVNSTRDPIPNPIGAPALSLAAATTALQQAFDQWNSIPTSYIDMRIVGTVANPGPRGFDMKNELTFITPAGFGIIASSPSFYLISDQTFVNGEDIDGDGDSDVSSAITTCRDADGDGDIEFPPGFYKAGTILDNDVQFNTSAATGVRFTTADAAIDTNTRSVDLRAVATHEFGHSHGLSHVLNNQKSEADGNSATMFPFIDAGDPAAELAQRSLDSDDIAWSSYFYPEGTAATGPAALQPGDSPFNLTYGLITGNVTHGVFGEPIAGASVSATNFLNGELFTSGFSGTTRVSFDPATGQIFLVSPGYNILDGKYTLPVKLGVWKIGIEAVDGLPVPSNSISITAQIGDAFGQQNFNEEFWNGHQEAAREVDPGQALPVASVPNVTVGGIDITTNDQINIRNFGTRDFVGFTGQPAGSYYAVQFPASQISALGDNALLQEGAFEVFLADASVVPVFAEAMLTTGTVTGATATLDLAHPLARDTRFIGEENDFSPFYFPLPRPLSRQVMRKIERGEIQNLFLVLRLPTTAPFPGVSAFPPFIGLDGGNAVNDVPIFGLSWASEDGVTFDKVNFNFRFSLIASQAP
jgi:hypothetical protein